MVEIFFPWSSVEHAKKVTEEGREAMRKIMAFLEKEGIAFNEKTQQFEKK